MVKKIKLTAALRGVFMVQRWGFGGRAQRIRFCNSLAVYRNEKQWAAPVCSGLLL